MRCRFVSFICLVVGATSIKSDGFVSTSAQAQSLAEFSKRHERYITEPDLIRQKFEYVHITRDKASMSPGYIFLALMDRSSGKWGPRIYNMNGDLVWHGSSAIGETRVSDFHVCDYLESRGTHLCLHDRKPNPLPGPHEPFYKKIFLDNTYSLVRNYTTTGDNHEFHVVDNGTKFVTVEYRPKRWDLRQYCGKRNGWIEDACLIEYEVQTGRKSWEWCFTDHLPVYETTVFFEADKVCQRNQTIPKAGKGTRSKPWDIGHLNAVDKDARGDYVTSFRHLNEVMKIAGPKNTHYEAGSIIWRLGGRGNQFEKDFDFSRQHMVRIVNETLEGDEIIMTLFNNAWDGVLAPTDSASSGQVFRIDAKHMKASLLHEYRHPNNKLAGSRGSMERLPNGNAFVGWGNIPEMSEYLENGTLVFHCQFAPSNTSQYSYRAFKSPWVGHPAWPPKLIAYTHSCRKKSPLFAYVSWNGATEVRQWRFFTSMTYSSRWKPAGTFRKSNFETQVRLDDPTIAYVLVEALDSRGLVLGHTIQETYVSPPELRDVCEIYACPDQFAYSERTNYRRTCNYIDLGAIISLLGLLNFLESCIFILGTIIRSSTGHASVVNIQDGS